MIEVMAVLEQLAQRDKMVEINENNKQDVVYSLKDIDNQPKIKKFLRDGETSITDVELQKRRQERCHNKIFMTKLDRIVEIANSRKQMFEDAHR